MIWHDIHDSTYTLGAWCSLGGSSISEILGRVGFDWVVIDLEHGEIGTGGLLDVIRGVEVAGSSPFVRVPATDPVYVKKALDYGAEGVIFPMVSNKEEAKLAVSCMRYQPVGQRGLAKAVRAMSYGLSSPEYLSEIAPNIVTILQLESRKSLESVESIASVKGVDVLFVGPVDLWADMGIEDDYRNEAFESLVAHMLKVCEVNGVCPGILCTSIDMMQWAVRKGFRFLAHGSDVKFLVSGGTFAVASFKQLLSQVASS